jgi:peptidoglycan/LPS O-acetylase OafA/YrhL
MSSKAAFHIPSLDGIRVVAFLLVFLGHAGLGKWVPTGFGVTIFFFLSGYLITTIIRREVEKFGDFDLKLFYTRRVLRIWPSFYLTLIAATGLILAGVLVGHVDWPGWLIRFLHVGNYGVINGWKAMGAGTQIFWSLAVEEHFYLVFPWFYLFLMRMGFTPKQQAWSMWGVCALVLLWRCILVFGFQVPDDRIAYASDTRVDSILFGCALAVYGNPMLDMGSEGRSWLDQRRSQWILLAIGLGLLAASFVIRTPGFRETFRYTMQGMALIPIFTVAIREPQSIVFRWLNIGWVRFVGALTYALYLVHFIVLSAVGQWLGGLHPFSQGALSMGISLGLAYLMYRLIEVPIVRLRKRFGRQSPLAVPALELYSGQKIGGLSRSRSTKPPDSTPNPPIAPRSNRPNTADPH